MPNDTNLETMLFLLERGANAGEYADQWFDLADAALRNGFAG